MTTLLDGASYILSPCLGRRITRVAGVESWKDTMNTRGMGEPNRSLALSKPPLFLVVPTARTAASQLKLTLGRSASDLPT